MITVEPTPRNWEIFSQLKALDVEFKDASDDERQGIILEAQKLCEQLEMI